MTSALHLERLRRKTGISLEAIAERTKISKCYLRAIELEEFDKLPGGVFNTNYIRQYASAIGFPEKRLLEIYQIKTAPEPEPEIAPAGFLQALRLKVAFWRPVAPRASHSFQSGRGH